MAPKLDCSSCLSAKGGAFACLKPEQWSRLEQAAVSHTYQRGQVLIYEGNPALAVFCVNSGVVKLTQQLSDGEVAVVGVRTAGDLLGYRAVLTKLPHKITAETVKPAVVCMIPREAFVALTKESHELTMHLLNRMAEEYRFTEDLLVERSGETVAKRMARFLSRLAEPPVPATESAERATIPVRREDLALLMGTTPETLSRAVHDLARRGLVSVDREEVRVLNLPALRRRGA